MRLEKYINEQELDPKEKVSLLKLLQYHGTKENPVSKASWGKHCKGRFLKLTGKPYSEEAAREAWSLV